MLSDTVCVSSDQIGVTGGVFGASSLQWLKRCPLSDEGWFSEGSTQHQTQQHSHEQQTHEGHEYDEPQLGVELVS